MKFLLLLTLCWMRAFGAPEEDLITSLPGASFEFPFRQFSGYLKASDTRHFFYWFTESQTDPKNDPVLLWLNGGPGCSSLIGFLTELGPFYVDQGGTGELHPNPYSWNTIANVLFLESPACVGFSYDQTGDCQGGDNSTALQNYVALQDFFSKFPEYKENEFYISGESYAGVYIPTLALNILDGDYPINLKGYAIGNGFIDQSTGDNSLMFFAYHHAILGDQLWLNLVASCCENSTGNRESCEFSLYAHLHFDCFKYVQLAIFRMFYGSLNPYNLYADCEPSTKFRSSRVVRNSRLYNDVTTISGIGLNRSLASDTPAGDYDPACLVDNEMEVTFLNDPATKEALHVVRESKEWTPCNSNINTNWSREYDSTLKLIEEASERIRILVYNGDVDLVSNFLGKQWALEDLNLPVINETRKWVVDEQVAGFVKRFENIDFVTVRGAGHMVPGYEPLASLHMLNSFLFQEPL